MSSEEKNHRRDLGADTKANDAKTNRESGSNPRVSFAPSRKAKELNGASVSADSKINGAVNLPSEKARRKPRIGDTRPARARIEPKSRTRGRPLGRYLACVHVKANLVQLAVLEGRNLIEHYVTNVNDGVTELLGNIYLGKVSKVLPGMEAAFVDIGTSKDAVLYQADVSEEEAEADDVLESQETTHRIEDVLKVGQNIVCQVIKNPIGAKGARLTQRINLPGRLVLLSPGSKSIGISKRLLDQERRRLRKIIEQISPDGFRIVVRTAAEKATKKELEADINNLAKTWKEIEERLRTLQAPALLYREPHMVLRVLREDLNEDFRAIYIDDRALLNEARAYVKTFNPELAQRIHYYDAQKEGLSLFEKFYVKEQLLKALEKKVWLPSGGSIVIESTEALTVIDVNTSKNLGTSNLEETVYKNNLEAAEEIARQLRLRDIGGIIVIDFIDMEDPQNRENVVSAFNEALMRDKTKTQVFKISELGLLEMARKRVGEGLVAGLKSVCQACNGEGMLLDLSLLD